MKRIIVSIFVLAASFMATSQAAYAASTLFPSQVCNESTRNSAVCQEQNRSQSTGSNSFYGPQGILIKAANIITIITGIAGVIMIAVSGIRYILASGDPSNVTAAKNTIIFTLVGLVVVVMARTIIVFIINRL